MGALTHMFFSWIYVFYFLALFKTDITLPLFALVTISSILPDIDNPGSLIGTIFRPVSNWANKKFGHRKLLHSFTFIGIMAAPAFFTIWFFFGTKYFMGFLLGYLSHCVLDQFNKAGVLFMYPSRKVWVVPLDIDLRAAVGGKGEKRWLIGLIIANCLITWLFVVGLRTILYRFRPSLPSANLYAIKYFPHYRIRANIPSGVWHFRGTDINKYKKKEFELVAFDFATFYLHDIDNPDYIYMLGGGQSSFSGVGGLELNALELVNRKPLQFGFHSEVLTMAFLSGRDINNVYLNGEMMIQDDPTLSEKIMVYNSKVTEAFPTITVKTMSGGGGAESTMLLTIRICPATVFKKILVDNMSLYIYEGRLDGQEVVSIETFEYKGVKKILRDISKFREKYLEPSSEQFKGDMTESDRMDDISGYYE